jgi:hypothetical protein
VSKQEQKVIDGVRPMLNPGEEPLVALVAQPKGTTRGIVGDAVVGSDALGGGQRRAAEEAAQAAEIKLSTPCALVLTNARLLTVKIGAPIGLGLGGKVKEVLSAVPLNEVDGVDVKKIALRQNITLRARGQIIELEANAAASGSELAERLAALKGGG